jgi:hypothetical protein
MSNELIIGLTVLALVFVGGPLFAWWVNKG